ncbi:serine/threonine-protein kinase [Leptolyngbya sp. FACHB-16]|uniref:serine/threonine-protein kinase n=1 Tax=unclassified Leptolyngbya TaxID=2650499 RepID=UPI0016887198|nr:serine/threonine-protein kinase [Leptolyngbya sp. FACHB-16]MBD2155090.1 serine/threonine protein kinase [Leptolyngbya sp. FACHB-16]
MSHCLNPDCPQPINPGDARFCMACGRSLRLGDRYHPLELLGQGGFGRTFMARDEGQPGHPLCVIKQFLPQQPGEEARQKAAELFRQEGEQLREIGKYPQIPTLYAYLEEEGCQYLIQEFIKGRTLEQELTEAGPFSELKIRHLLNSLLPVLQALHDHQIIHRDIKPTNIIRRQESANAPLEDLVLVDFGASKYANPTVLARTGTLIGSAGYAAPEQVMGRAEFVSDLYSLGVTCIHLMTGLHPFDLYSASDDAWVWQDFLTEPVSDRLAQVLNKLLRRPTSQRFRSATAVLQALNQTSSPVIRVGRRVPLAVGSRPDLTLAPAESVESQPVRRNWECVFNLEGHTGPVTAIAISPDGLLLASGSTDRSIKLWHLESGTLMHTWSGRSLRFQAGHTEAIATLAFSADGCTLISGSEDCTLRWWDLETRKLIRRSPEHGWLISALALSQNGALVASGGGDGLINLWEQESGEPLAHLHKHRDRISSLLLSPDGQTLISGSYDRTLRLWDLRSDRIIRTLWGHSDRISATAISSNWLTLISTGWDRTLRFWNLSEGKAVHTQLAHQDAVTCLALSPNNRLLASGSEDNRIKLWDLKRTESGVLVPTGDRPLALPYAWSVSALAFSPDGQVLVSGSPDETVRVWQMV